MAEYQSVFDGKQIDEGIGKIINGALDKAVLDAQTAAGQAENALSGVTARLDVVPTGSTQIINDLTTGGAGSALSAGMGKQLRIEAEKHESDAVKHIGTAKKAAAVDGDSVVLVDSADAGKTKRLLWSNIKALFAPAQHGHQITDVASLESSLSNKAANSYGYITTANLLEWAGQQAIGGSFYVNAATTTAGLPPAGGGYYSGTIDINSFGGFHSLRARSMTDLSVWENVSTYSADGKFVWTGWKQIATTTPPTEYDLPLAAGLTDGGSEYHKNQFNEVTVGLAVSGAIAADAVVATLPAGYRPKSAKQMAVTAISTGGTAVAGCCIVDAATGQIINKCGGVSKLVGELAFVAAD